MATNLRSAPLGMTTLGPGPFIVCRREGHLNPFWATRDGKNWFSGTDLASLAQELIEQNARRVFALPRRDAPSAIVNLTKKEQAQLLDFLGFG
jgi:hypothetical protein